MSGLKAAPFDWAIARHKSGGDWLYRVRDTKSPNVLANVQSKHAEFKAKVDCTHFGRPPRPHDLGNGPEELVEPLDLVDLDEV